MMEPRAQFTITDVMNLFRVEERYKSSTTLFQAEAAGAIPTAARTFRGKVPVRHWSVDQLPSIGAKYGFLRAPNEQHIVCVHTGKGGVLKSSFAMNFARTAALNGIKTIVIGLDIQITITNYLMKRIDSLDDFDKKKRRGLYELLVDGSKLSDVIQKTDLDTLDIIPETPKLRALDEALRMGNRKEYRFQDDLIPLLKKYQLVVFDNSPNWNVLVENSLTCANHSVSPIGCDLGCYEALEENFKNVLQFQKRMKLTPETSTFIPTLLEKNKLSAQIYAAYLSQYENVQTTPIRRTISGQESLWLRQSVLEVAPNSDLAQDYFEAIKTLWEKILTSEAEHGV